MQVLEKLGSRYLRDQLPGLHRSLGPLSPSEAEFMFVRECSQYPVSFALHLFRTLEPFRRPPRGGSIGRSVAGNTSASSSNSSFLNGTSGSANSRSAVIDSRFLCVGISGKGIELFEVPTLATMLYSIAALTPTRILFFSSSHF